MKIRLFAILALLVSLSSCYEEIPVTGITLDTSSLTLPIDGSDKLTVSISPANADNKLVVWRTEDKSVASVSADGLVTAIAPGITQIIAKSDDGGFEAVCTVEVLTNYVGVESVTLEPNELIMQKGDVKSLAATVLPDNATNPGVHWLSTDEKVATVSNAGEVKAIAPGKASIVVTVEDGGLNATCEVTVEQHVTAISISPQSLELEELQQAIITPTVSPEDAVDKSLLWESSDENVVTVTDGVVRAIKTGSAKITATSVDNKDIKAECSVTVICKTAGVKLENHELSMVLRESVKLEYTVYPERANNKEVKWSVDRSDIVGVSPDGTITANNPGEAVVTVTTTDGNYEDKCKVKVDYEVQGVSVTPNELRLCKGKSRTLEATIVPSTATVKDVRWESSDDNVARVNSTTGEVTGRGIGEAVITVTTKEGGRTATCKVIVDYEVQSVSVTPNELLISVNKKRSLVAAVSPSDAANQKVSWASSNNEIAWVNSSGEVTGRSPGEAVITVTTDEGGRTATCKVIVDYEVQSISLTPNELQLNVNESRALAVEITPADASNKKVKWLSSNDDVARVSNTGEVTGRAPGEAVITATSDDGDRTATCKVVVVSEVAGVTLDQKELNLTVDETADLMATVTPDNASNKQVNWSSSDEKVATVDNNGHVVAKGSGQALICATSAAGGKHAYCKVSVRKKVTSVALNPSEETIFVGKTAQFTTTILPEEVSDEPVEWTVDDPSVATVNASGLVTAVAKGTTKVRATTKKGQISGSADVTVLKPVSSISVSQTSWVIYLEDEPLTVPVSVLPEDASDVSFYSVVDKPGVVVSADGNKITPVAVGNAKVAFKPNLPDPDKTLSAMISVDVRAHVKTVSVSSPNSTISVGGQVQLEVAVSPENAYDKTVTWSSSNKAVATVTSTGLVKGLSNGEVTITATSNESPSVSESCKIKVTNIEVSSIELNKYNLSMTVGDSETLIATVLPDNAPDKSLEWESYKPDVATVDQNGKVTAVSKGQATIRVRSKAKAGVYKDCMVTVENKVILPESITVSPSTLEIRAGEQEQLKVTVTPSNVTDPTIVWSSDKTGVATVVNGMVTGVSEGTAVITATIGGLKSSATVTVLPPIIHVSGISLSRTSATMATNKTLTLVATVSPSDATNKKVKWSSSKESVATVSQTGVVTSKNISKDDTVIITASPEDNPSLAATCEIKVVTNAVALTDMIDIRLNGTKFTGPLYVGQIIELTANYAPSNASIESIVWSVSAGAPFMAQAIGDGKKGRLTGVKTGIGNLKVEATDVLGTQKSRTIQIQVLTNNVASVSLNHTNLTLKAGEVYNGLVATVTGTVSTVPASNSKVNWTSSDSSVATVDASGKITTKKAGTATITVRSAADSSKSATCTLTVISTNPGSGGNEGVEFDDWNF